MMDTTVSYTQNRANLPYSRSDWNQVHDAPVYVMSLQGIPYKQEYRGSDSNQIAIFLSHTLHTDLLTLNPQLRWRILNLFLTIQNKSLQEDIKIHNTKTIPSLPYWSFLFPWLYLLWWPTVVWGRFPIPSYFPDSRHLSDHCHVVLPLKKCP